MKAHNSFRTHQRVQCTLASGERKLLNFTVEQITINADRIYFGRVFHDNVQTRVKLLASGEWMPCDEEGKRLEWHHWEFDKWSDYTPSKWDEWKRRKIESGEWRGDK